MIAAAIPAIADDSLKSVPIPVAPNLDRYVRDSRTLVALGKALFWDLQVGSDGRTACATCHFHAGADHRVQNQLSNPGGDFTPDYRLKLDDYPFRLLSDPGDNRSPALRDSAQRTGSAGVFCRTFAGLPAGAMEDGADSTEAPQFRVSGLNIRQVTPRNAPSVINAVFNVRSFRDGRASDVFTGRTPFGDSDPALNVLGSEGGGLIQEAVRLANSSLASQAVAPPVNTVEMSYAGRTWVDIGRKLLRARPLASQTIAMDDSVLGPYADPGGRGFAPGYTYQSLIQAVFAPRYWDSPLPAGESGATLAEFNFPLFFALAIQAYESTLVSDDSPFDRFAAGSHNALTAQQTAGFLDFQTDAFCRFCHFGAEFTNASVSFGAANGSVARVVSGAFGSLQQFQADTGFFATGVRPAAEDSGLDGIDDFGASFSLASRQHAAPLAISGAFKVPGLRNVELTGPYFHNGSQATLEQVLDFYGRGGDFPQVAGLPVEITPVVLDSRVRSELLSFLKALTDERVRYERAPFDHPELCVPVGYPAQPASEPDHPSSAQDTWAGIPAIGAAGNAVPLQTFEELLEGVGSDGSRAHNLNDACTIPGFP